MQRLDKTGPLAETREKERMSNKTTKLDTLPEGECVPECEVSKDALKGVEQV